MQSLYVICVLSVVGLCLGETVLHPRGCIYIDGICIRECEEGTRAYAIGCDYLMPEATCDNPEPELNTRGQICDFSACYCEPPTVRDTVSKKCVLLEDCPKKE